MKIKLNQNDNFDRTYEPPYTGLHIDFLCIFLIGRPIKEFGEFFYQNSSKISQIILIINSKIN